jgi:hypothetical protein
MSWVTVSCPALLLVAILLAGCASAPPTATPLRGGPGSTGGGRAAPVGRGCPQTHPIKGNASSMIYHLPGQEFYSRTVPEECFATEADAQRAGYRRSQR